MIVGHGGEDDDDGDMDGKMAEGGREAKKKSGVMSRERSGMNVKCLALFVEKFVYDDAREIMWWNWTGTHGGTLHILSSNHHEEIDFFYPTKCKWR